MATSLLVFIVVYFLVFGAGVFYVLRLMGKAPGDVIARYPDEAGAFALAIQLEELVLDRRAAAVQNQYPHFGSLSHRQNCRAIKKTEESARRVMLPGLPLSSP